MLPRDLSREKAQHEEKSANFGTKVPVKRRKTGSFSAKVAHLRTPLGFPPSELPFHDPATPRFLRPHSHVCAISPHHHLPVRAVFGSRHTLATRNTPAAHTGKDVRLELHAPMPEDTPFTDANSGRTQRMIEKQTRKCHKNKDARTREAIRTTETAAQTLHSFLRNAEGRAGKD